METTRHCKHCSADHPLTAEFWASLNTRPSCKKYSKDYRAKNKENLAEKNRVWREENAEKHKQSARDHYYANKQRKNEQSRAYHKNNRESINRQRKVWLSKVENRLGQNLRVRLVMAIRRGSKVGSAVKDLGCSIAELKQYLELKFQFGMTWDNYGAEWHIDHIRPLANYDLSDREVLKQLVHYTNLQPLWAADNLRKSNKEE